MPKQRRDLSDLSDPAFPHGRHAGYNRGCRKGSPCPATPTCNEAHNKHIAEGKRRRKLHPPVRVAGPATSGDELLIGQLRALGYPTQWVDAQREHLTVEALHARIGDTPADPARDGIDAETIDRTKVGAREDGYYPPICYDDGVLNVRAIPDHPWSRADARVAKSFDLIDAIARGTMSASAMVRDGLAHDTTTVDRMRKRLGLRYVYDHRDGVRLRPECKARAAWIRSMIEDYNDGVRGPVEVALTIGSVDAVISSHPERIAWEATQPYVRALAWMLYHHARLSALVAAHGRPRIDMREAA